MRVYLPCPPDVAADLVGLHAAIAALSLSGFTGCSSERGGVAVEFPGRDEELTEDEAADVAAVVAAHVPPPDWAPVRATRAPLLEEADWRIERAEDQGDDPASLRAYRQALRDVTAQPDPGAVTWPTPPWLA